MLHLDRINARGLHCTHAAVPKGKAWSRMSDHLPLLMTLQVA
jgi:endonuclease/exonuclease/phosphatase family metal-dependent hydrolase